MNDSVLVRVKSHRAGDRLKRLLGELEWFFSFRDGGVFVKVPSSRLTEVLAIPSVTRARPNGEVYRCW